MKRVLPLMAVIVLLCIGAEAVATPVQWSAADGGNGHWYEALLVPDGLSWSSARAEAERRGGHLATVASLEENRFVYSLVSGTPDFWWRERNNYSIGPWLGGYQDPSDPSYQEPNGGWKWVTGEPWQYTNWQTGEPNDSGGESCLHFLGRIGIPMEPFWNDYADGGHPEENFATPHGYIMEWDTAVPEPSPISALAAGLGALLALRRR